MKEIALVFVGGGLGCVSRFLIGKAFLSRYVTQFPWATFAVNVLASAVLGYLLTLLAKKPEGMQWVVLLLGISFCGGLSTFSTFSYENFSMIQKGEVALFLIYTFISLVVCLAAVAAGYYVARSL